MEKLWSLCYGKAKIPSLKLIAKEFALGIVEKTNMNQRFKFFKWLEKMEMQRKKMKGLNISLQKTSRFPSMKHWFCSIF
jgi:hypothetical protein